MSRPKITSQLLLALTSAAPSRVQKRLDKNPNLAADWNWSTTQLGFQVETGTQVVTISAADGVLSQAEQITCDCLLSPKCLHVLACVTQLEIVNGADGGDPESEEPDTQDNESRLSESADTNQVATTSVPSATVKVADELFAATSDLLAVGCQRASTVLLGSLLQAAHHARADGVHWPAAAAIRLVEGVRKLRNDSKDFDLDRLQLDLFELLSACCMLRNQTDGWQNTIGTARRAYRPRPDALKLHGVFVEPILTNDGFAGMVVYLKDEQHHWYTISQVRRTVESSDPSQQVSAEELLAAGWSGGITVGKTHVTAKQLMGSRVLIRGGGVSDDGRLGLGTKCEFAMQDDRWLTDSLHQWLTEDLATQVERVASFQATAELARPAGWNLVGLHVEVVAANKAHLIVRNLGADQLLPLGVYQEQEILEYRRNLERLATVPGLRMFVVAKLDLQRPECLFPLVIAPAAESADQEEDAVTRPKLILPSEEPACWQLGWQRLQPEHLSKTSEPTPLQDQAWSAKQSQLGGVLQQRIRGLMLAGHYAIPDPSSDVVQVEVARLLEAWLETPASLLMELASTGAQLRTADSRNQIRESTESLAELWTASHAWSTEMNLRTALQRWAR